MKTGHLLFFSLIVLFVASCSSGKKAFEKGEYYEAVAKAVQRLKQKPDHDKSKETLKNAYPLALQELEQEAQNMLASNEMFKHRNTIGVYQRINSLAELVKSSPAALGVIRTPKTYYPEIGQLKEKASEELYAAGIQSMLKATRHDSRQAFFYFKECESFVPRYKEALEMMTQSERDGTLNVLYEETTHSYWTSSANFIKRIDEIQFIDLIHKNAAVAQLDKKKFDLNMLVSILKYSEGKPVITKKEQEIIDSVKVGEKTVNNVKVPTYQKIKGKFISYEKKVESIGSISISIHDNKTGNIVFSEEFKGTGRWSGSWASCTGDSRVFNKNQKQTCEKREPEPDIDAMKKQAREQIDSDVYNRLSNFLKNY